jgi:hypothetical protein
MSLNRLEILQVQDRKVIELEVPEWGGTIHIRAMSAAMQDRIDAAYLDQTASGFDRRSVLTQSVAAACICDPSGKRLFSDEDAAALAEKSAVALRRIWDKVREISRLTEEKIEAKMGESRAGRSAGSSSGSVSLSEVPGSIPTDSLQS